MTQLKDYSKNISETNTFNQFLSKVFITVFGGLVLTSVVAFVMSLFIERFLNLFYGVYFVIIILQFAVGIYFSARLEKMSKTSAWVCYGIYSLTMGITFSILPLAYDGGSILFAILMTALMFVCMAIIGHTTKVDLSKFSTLFFAGLIAIIVVTMVNSLFIHSYGVNMFINYFGVILFLGIIAWDMQKMRTLYLEGLNNPEFNEKMIIYGAFELYLDFLNLFIRILQIFGKSRND